MKLYFDSMKKKHLRWVLADKKMPLDGTKAQLKLRLQQHLESERVDIAEFCIEEEQAEKPIPMSKLCAGAANMMAQIIKQMTE